MAALQPCQVQQITPKSITRTVSAVRKSPHTFRSTSTTTVCEALLDWADVSGVDPRPVAVQQHSEYGRCLVATEDIPNGTVLLSVPLEQVFQSQAADELELHWAAEMALRLLQARHASRHQHDGSSSSSSSSSPGSWAPWVDSLPQHVVTPVEFTTEEVEQLVIPSTVQAVLGARESLEGCFEVLQPQLAEIGCTWDDFLWAVQVLHSRCFYEGTAARHMAVPGVDMCNHSYQPNATVRLVHSPAACQGLDALEEVAPVAAAAACPSYFQLVADTNVCSVPQGGSMSSDALRMLMRPDAIQAGDQVCISYGPWPTEPLLLLFGFVPQHNPHDSLVLFSDLEHMADCFLEAVASSATQGSPGDLAAAAGGSSAASAGAAAAAADPAFAERLHEQLSAAEVAAGGQQQQQAVGPPGYRDLTLTDTRLRAAVQMLHKAVSAAAEQWCAQTNAVDQQQQQQAEAVQQELGARTSGVVRFRLQQLAQQLEEAATQASKSRSEEQVEVVDEHISYRSSAEHRHLIAAYCSSKAQLARQLLAKL